MPPDLERLQRAAEPGDLPFWKGACQGALIGLLGSLALALPLDWLLLDGWLLNVKRLPFVLGIAMACGAVVQGGRKSLAAVPKPVRYLVWRGIATTVPIGGVIAAAALGLAFSAPGAPRLNEMDWEPAAALILIISAVTIFVAIPPGFILGVADAKDRAAHQFGEQWAGPKVGHVQNPAASDGARRDHPGQAQAMTTKRIQS